MIAETGERFPEKVTAFREGMAAHGRYGKPCPACGTPIQRIQYATNEANYCPTCQTGGKLLADRGLSRLLKDDWPKSLEELERFKADAQSHSHLAFGLDEFRFLRRFGRRRSARIDLALEGQAIRQVFMRGLVRAREECIERCGVVAFGLAHLDARIRAVLAPRHIAMPEVDVPAGELPNPLEPVRVGAPVFARQRDVAAIDRDPLFSRRDRDSPR